MTLPNRYLAASEQMGSKGTPQTLGQQQLVKPRLLLAALLPSCCCSKLAASGCPIA